MGKRKSQTQTAATPLAEMSDRTSAFNSNDNIPQTMPFSQENSAQNPSGENVLPTAKELDRQRRAAKAETETERTGILLGVPEKIIRTVQRLAKIIGKEVVFYRNTDGKVKNDLGYYNHNDGKIYLNADAKDPVAIILGHEMIHDIQLTDGYISFFKTVLRKMQADGINLSEARAELKARYAKNGVDLDTTAKIDQDLVAEYAQEHLFTDEASIASIVNADKESGHKILNFLDRILAKLGNKDARERAFVQKARALYAKALRESRGLETGGEYRGDTASAKSMAETKTASETMADVRRETTADLRSTAEPMAGQNEARTMDAMTDAEYDARLDMEEAEASMAGQSMLYDDGRQFMIGDEDGAEKYGETRVTEEKISTDMPEDSRYEVLKNKRNTPATTENVDASNIDFPYLESNIKSTVEKGLLKKFQELGLFKTYRSVAVGDIAFDFTGKGFRKSIHSQENFYGGSKADFAKVLLNLQNLLDSSVLIEMHTDKGKGTNKEKRGLDKVYVLFSALEDGEIIIPVQFEIEQYIGRDNRLYLAVALTKIETGVKGNMASDEQKATSLVPVSDISISEIFAKINPSDKNFLKYIPNQFLNAEQIAAKEEALEADRKKYLKNEENGRQYAIAKEDAAVSQRETSAVEEPETMESIAKTYGEVKRTRRELEKVNRRMRLSDEDKIFCVMPRKGSDSRPTLFKSNIFSPLLA